MPSKEEVRKAELLGKKLADNLGYSIDPVRTYSSKNSKRFRSAQRIKSANLIEEMKRQR